MFTKQLLLRKCFKWLCYLPGGSLAEYVEEHRRTGGRFQESELVQILYQVAQGLRYIHSQNLVHLDIKPGMLFLFWYYGKMMIKYIIQ